MPASELHDYHLPETHCPECGARSDGAYDAKTNSGHGPKPNDIVICIECYAVLKYGLNMDMQRIVPPERLAYVRNLPEVQAALEALRVAAALRMVIRMERK